MATLRITGTLRRTDGTVPTSEGVRVTPSTAICDTAGDVVYTRDPFVVQIDDEGSFMIELPAPGEDLTPAGWSYTLAPSYGASFRCITIPAIAGAYDLADLLAAPPVEPEPGTEAYRDLAAEFEALAAELTARILTLEERPTSAAHWDTLEGKPAEFPPAEHEHDDRYVRTVNGSPPDEDGDVTVEGGGGDSGFLGIYVQMTGTTPNPSANWPDAQPGEWGIVLRSGRRWLAVMRTDGVWQTEEFGATIMDTGESTYTTWSAVKIRNEIAAAASSGGGMQIIHDHDPGYDDYPMTSDPAYYVGNVEPAYSNAGSLWLNTDYGELHFAAFGSWHRLQVGY